MKIILSIFIFFLANTIINAQYISPEYYKINYVKNNGDTINRIDKKGLYQGEWIIFDNPDCKINDTSLYATGYFKNGKPIGVWKCYNKTVYGIGKYKTGTQKQETKKGKVRYIKKNRTGITKGVWKIYDRKADTLIRYEKECRCSFLFIELEKSYEKLINENKFRKTEKYYNDWLLDNYSATEYYQNGNKKHKEKKCFFYETTIDYYKNGKIKTRNKCKDIHMGRQCIKEQYSKEGKLIGKKKYNFKAIIDPAF